MYGFALLASYELIEHKGFMFIALLALWLFAIGCMNALGLRSSNELKMIFRDCALFHLVFAPWLLYMLAYDLEHPELWVDWKHDPNLYVPFTVCMEIVVAAAFIYRWARDRQMARGTWWLKEALRLQALGNHEAAEVAYREGRKLMRSKID